MTKANCQPEDLPYYVILHIIPEDPGKLTQPERGFNNEDFKPDIFTDNDICMTLTYAPNYRVKNVKIGQYESRLGSRWSAQVNVAAFNAAIGQ